ncbi:C-type lectin domain family 10 member A [Anabarilius grahami]|uniref:C-type lectin domain family 10 member A n=1 Tax=Anabarilius grahami TaxID=495550 RepID=A0A3N0XIX7_ANAGA|nr:C-type lectin domain family 10 member A [Anabarilius grahami]
MEMMTGISTDNIYQNDDVTSGKFEKETTDCNATRIQSSELTDGWTYYQSSLYFISSETKSWNESRRYCRDRGADLIIINNTTEQGFVNRISGNISGNTGVWIGLSEADGGWKWVDGSAPNSE